MGIIAENLLDIVSFLFVIKYRPKRHHDTRNNYANREHTKIRHILLCYHNSGSGGDFVERGSECLCHKDIARHQIYGQRYQIQISHCTKVYQLFN